MPTHWNILCRKYYFEMTGDSQPWRPQQRNAYCNVHFSKNDITARNGIFIPPKIYTEDLIIIFNIYILTISFFIENCLIISRQIFDIIRRKWENIVYFRFSNKQISKIRKVKRVYDICLLLNLKHTIFSHFFLIISKTCLAICNVGSKFNRSVKSLSSF